VKNLLPILLAVLFVGSADAQLFRRQILNPCPGGVCQPAIVYDSPAVQPVPKETVAAKAEETASAWYRTLRGPGGSPISPENEATIRSWANRAVRILNGNSCGTGSLCGRDDTGIYILTNAHVAGSRIGHTVNCEALLADGSATEKFQARVIEAAYSSKTSTDWALLKADARYMKGLQPIKLSTTEPDYRELTGTWGCPQCEVPSGQLCRTVQLGSLWYWQPNSIGGQSGSAVVQDGTQKGLLTWTINGNGAGQKTSTIYRQSQQQNTDGPARVPGLLIPASTAAVELVEGYHRETSSLSDYPIWDTGPSDGGGGGGGQTPAPCPEINEAEKQLREQLGSDWPKLMEALLEFSRILK
jgi:hypothetical protein